MKKEDFIFLRKKPFLYSFARPFEVSIKSEGRQMLLLVSSSI